MLLHRFGRNPMGPAQRVVTNLNLLSGEDTETPSYLEGRDGLDNRSEHRNELRHEGDIRGWVAGVHLSGVGFVVAGGCGSPKRGGDRGSASSLQSPFIHVEQWVRRTRGIWGISCRSPRRWHAQVTLIFCRIKRKTPEMAIIIIRKIVCVAGQREL